MSEGSTTSKPSAPPRFSEVSEKPTIASRARAALLGPTGKHGDEPEHTAPWWHVMWLSGVDYFSTLGYQPAIAFVAAGSMSPIATLLLVGVTLFAALPVYRQVARHSWAGKGSIAMLERLLPGWWGKLLVLTLLGFAATDFVITMTLSAADAAEHAIENPFLHPFLDGHQMGVTLAFVTALAAVFLAGFREAITIAMRVGIPYIVLSAIVILAGLWKCFWSPEAVLEWRADLALHGSWPQILIASAFIFPKLALGLSGFETGVSVMPQVSNVPPGLKEPSHDKTPLASPQAFAAAAAKANAPPVHRVKSTGNLLMASAVIMSVLLVGSSFVTTILIPPEAFEHGGEASGRALAYLAHHLLGSAFGTVYDAVTIAILWFAGASAMAGLLNLIPRYLPRFGMAPVWVEKSRPLVLAFLFVNVIVTLIFDASVEAQGGAYATGVLALMLSAAIAVTLALRKTHPLKALYFAIVTLVFAYVFAANVATRPDGVIISACFIFAVLLFGAISRWRRSTELRVEKIDFADDESRRLWEQLRGKRVNLVPLEHMQADQRRAKALEVRQHYKLEGALAFLHVELTDDTSEFDSNLRVHVTQVPETGNYVILVGGAVAIANTIAFISEELDPRALLLGLTRANPMSQALRYLLWGEGEIGVLVYEILVKHWEATPEDDVRPLIYLLSD